MTTADTAAHSTADEFVRRVERKEAVIGIIGMGYVGLPLAQAYVRRGYKVLGFDILPHRVAQLMSGESYIKHFTNESMKEMVESGLFNATADFDRLAEPDALLICVPTPLDKHREPDLSYVLSTVEQIGSRLRKGQLVVLESTTYPGTTDEMISPKLADMSGLDPEHDFGVAYSPEREDPGNPNFSTSTIPKVVGGVSQDALRMGIALYKAAVDQVVPVSDTRTAEAVKLTENIFRLVNIALVNELKTIYDDMDIDVWEVIRAADTKPFGFMAFWPGPGLGGHCIPIDPFYLTWKARAYGNPTRFIELAGEINRAMPRYVVTRLAEAMNMKLGKALNGSRILLVGLSYKPNIDDMRESPSIELLDLLEKRGAHVEFHDPYIPEVPEQREHPELIGRKSFDLTDESIRTFDAVLIATNHAVVDYEQLIRSAPLVVDTRDATVDLKDKYDDKIVKA
jgi:UDP-N-acetyl-D-glucosamine dehydrogenase